MTKKTIHRNKFSPDRTKKKQLFLLHFAGGNCYSFDFLKEHLIADVDFIPLELPGRGRRFGEELLKNKALAIQDYYHQIKELRNDQKYLIYGHSMGADLSLTLTHLLEELNDPPCQLIVSGHPGPDVEKTEAAIQKGNRYEMSEEAFKEDLRELGGMPEEVLVNDQLYHFFSPILRADFELLERDAFSEKGMLLKTPIYALMGSEEEDKNQIENWKRFTVGKFQYEILKGDHFFIKNHSREISQLLKNKLFNS